jgi:hypothetical protein
MFNTRYRILICRAEGHANVIPSTGSTVDVIANNLWEHFRRNHRIVHQNLDSGFFVNIIRPFVGEGILSAQDFLLIITKDHEPISQIEGLPLIEGHQCLQCGYSGPPSTVKKHLLQHPGSISKVYIQQPELTGCYIVVIRKGGSSPYFKNNGWKAIFDVITNTSQNITVSTQPSESGFVRTTGWIGCIEGKGLIYSKMVNIDDDLGRLLVRQVKDYFEYSNAQITRENITLRRWIGSSGYVAYAAILSLSLLIPFF